MYSHAANGIGPLSACLFYRPPLPRRTRSSPRSRFRDRKTGSSLTCDIGQSIPCSPFPRTAARPNRVAAGTARPAGDVRKIAAAGIHRETLNLKIGSHFNPPAMPLWQPDPCCGVQHSGTSSYNRCLFLTSYWPASHLSCSLGSLDEEQHPLGNCRCRWHTGHAG